MDGDLDCGMMRSESVLACAWLAPGTRDAAGLVETGACEVRRCVPVTLVSRVDDDLG